MATGRVPTTANSPLTAKGDLFTYSTAPARLAVGNSGEQIVADSSTSTGLRYQAPVAVNPVINGAFDIWQRGTSASLGGSGVVTSADRWATYTAVTAATLSRQTTGDTTNLPSIQYCARMQRTAGTNTAGDLVMCNNFETTNSIPYAGKTVTVSFYVRAGANFSAAASAFTCYLRTGTGTDQNSTSVGYTGLALPISTSFTATTTWQRFTATGTVASTATEIALELRYTATGTTAGAADYLEVTGVQLEVGSVATPFRRSGGTIQGETSACQRYYQRIDTSTASFVGHNRSTVSCDFTFPLKVTMRTAPTQSYTLGSAYLQVGAANVNATAIAQQDAPTTDISSFRASVASGLTAASASLFFGSSTIIQMSAEL